MARPATPKPALGKRALVVDDVDNLGHVMCRALQRLGYEVDRAHDGQEALSKGREHEYDAVVCDLLMPRMNGRALYETWEVEKPGLTEKVIFVTGDSVSEGNRAFIASTGRPCVYKPFQFCQLVEAVAAMEESQSVA